MSSFGLKFLLTGGDDFVDETKWFLLNIGPTAIFFIATVSMLSHWGVTQWIVGKFAAIFFHSMQVSGAEAVVASSSPFLGAGEAAVLIRPYLKYLSTSSMFQWDNHGLC